MANFRIIEAIINCIDMGAVEVAGADVNHFFEVAMRLELPVCGGAITETGRVFYIDRLANY